MEKLKIIFLSWQFILYRLLALLLGILQLTIMTIIVPFKVRNLDDFERVFDRWWVRLKYDELIDEWW